MVGEWSFATDSCQQWINGFQYNEDPPIRECAWVECPYGDMENPMLAPLLNREVELPKPWGIARD